MPSQMHPAIEEAIAATCLIKHGSSSVRLNQQRPDFRSYQILTVLAMVLSKLSCLL